MHGLDVSNPVLVAMTPQAQREVFFYLGLIVAAALVLVIVALIVRRIVLGPASSGDDTFTLADLRAMHAQGQLSDDEFESARRKMIAQHRSWLDEPSAGKNPTVQSDKDGDDEAAGGP